MNTTDAAEERAAEVVIAFSYGARPKTIIIAEAIRAAEAAEREACATLVESIRMDEMLLACGEMSTQERRTARALLPWLAGKIRARVDK